MHILQINVVGCYGPFVCLQYVTTCNMISDEFGWISRYQCRIKNIVERKKS